MRETNCIVGIPEEYGGSGDSSIPTAQGVIYGIKATNQVLEGSNEIGSKTYAIQGLGKVGFKVAVQLLEEGASLYVSDINPAAIDELKKFGKGIGNESIKEVEGSDIYGIAADVFVPCALGGIIHDESIERLNVKAIVGSANNQLKEDIRHGDALREKGILFAPDYIVNAGGLIQVSDELYGPSKKRVMDKTKAIYTSLLEIYKTSENHGISTVEAANHFVENRIEARKQRNSFFSHKRPKWDIKH
jgi:phenylalanine dehydrogenase